MLDRFVDKRDFVDYNHFEDKNSVVDNHFFGKNHDSYHRGSVGWLEGMALLQVGSWWKRE